MSAEISRWTYGLLFATLIVATGIVGIVAARCSSARSLSGSLFLQGVLMTFVMGSTFLNVTGDTRLGGLVIVGLLLVHSGCTRQPEANYNSRDATKRDSRE